MSLNESTGQSRDTDVVGPEKALAQLSLVETAVTGAGLDMATPSIQILQNLDSSVNLVDVLRVIQPLVDRLLLELVDAVSYSGLHPFVLCHEGTRSMNNPIRREDHFAMGPLSRACDCVGAAVILERHLKGVFSKIQRPGDLHD